MSDQFDKTDDRLVDAALEMVRDFDDALQASDLAEGSRVSTRKFPGQGRLVVTAYIDVGEE